MKSLFRWSKVGILPPDLWTRLQELPRATEYTYPCAANDKSGTTWPRVLFVERADYFRHFPGTWGTKRPFLEVESVESILPSPSKTPVSVEKKLYEHGETHMGGRLVVLGLGDGTCYFHAGGDFCEFVSVPEGYSASDVSGVVAFGSPQTLPGTPRFHGWLRAPDWKWCVFRRP